MTIAEFMNASFADVAAAAKAGRVTLQLDGERVLVFSGERYVGFLGFGSENSAQLWIEGV